MRGVVAFNFVLYAANAFTIKSFNVHTRTREHSLRTAIFSTTIEDEVTTRRQWATKSAVSAATLALISKPKSAGAISRTTEATLAPSESVSVASPLCDPSVSTFRNPTNKRVVHILGTAHISSASADVAGQLVRDIKPSAVFVELDAKRVGRAIPKPKDGDNNDDATDTRDTNGTSSSTAAAPVSTSASMVKSSSPSPSAGLSDAVQTSSQQDAVPQAAAAAPKTKNPFNIKEKVLNKASQAVGNGIKGLYKKLESDGFSAGEEFVVAVREGLNVGSKIILGDQDVEITLRRLTEALTKTDLKKLLSADTEMEENMKQFLPDNGKSLEGNGTGEMSKEEFSYFVETIKAKDNVKMLMANLKSVAPEVYQAMVGERDLYMANGLDRLNQFDSIVAVMGIAHVDGVEGILQERGWVEVKYSTCN